MKRIISLLLSIIVLLCSFSGCNVSENQNSEKLSIVTTIFPYYDFVKNIVGDNADVFMLLPIGAESHNYEPSPKDIVKINECDIFIYNGGESDSWVETILSTINSNVKTMSMFDYITPICTDSHNHKDKEHHHNDYDEHIWTSLDNSGILTEIISQEIIKADSKNKKTYRKNTDAYLKKLKNLDSKFLNFFKDNKQTLVIADRFPLIYFTNRYNIEYISAFNGCSSETEPTIETIKLLTDYVIDNDVSTIFHIDTSNEKLANLIADDTGVKVATLYSCHNITKEQFDNGETYYSLMEENFSTLKEAF